MQQSLVNGINDKHSVDPPDSQNCQNNVNDRNGLSEELPVWEMAPRGQLKSCKGGVDTIEPSENLDDFAQSIQIIRRALV